MTFVAYYLSWSRQQDAWKGPAPADDRQTGAIAARLKTGVSALSAERP
jgi:hypothetical protein